MKYIKYCVLGLVSLFLTTILSFRIGHMVGQGDNGIGYVIAGVALLNATIITCTSIIVDLIKK